MITTTVSENRGTTVPIYEDAHVLPTFSLGLAIFI